MMITDATIRQRHSAIDVCANRQPFKYWKEILMLIVSAGLFSHTAYLLWTEMPKIQKAQAEQEAYMRQYYADLRKRGIDLDGPQCTTTGTCAPMYYRYFYR